MFACSTSDMTLINPRKIEQIFGWGDLLVMILFGDVWSHSSFWQLYCILHNRRVFPCAGIEAANYNDILIKDK